MSYKIRPLQPEDLDYLYPAQEADYISRFGFAREEWSADMFNCSVAADNDMHTILLRFPSRREHPNLRYLFRSPDGVVLLEKKKYCLFSIVHASNSTNQRIDVLTNQMREAFKAAGEWIDGVTDPSSENAVPYAQFIVNQ